MSGQTAGLKGKMNEEHRKQAYPLWWRSALTIVVLMWFTLIRERKARRRNERKEQKRERKVVNA